MERLFDDCCPLLVHSSTDSHNELIDAENAIPVNIKHVEKNRYIFFRDSSFEIAASLAEFLLRERPGVIVVHYLEDSLETDDASGASSLDLVFEYLDELRSIRILNTLLSRFNL